MLDMIPGASDRSEERPRLIATHQRFSESSTHPTKIISPSSTIPYTTTKDLAYVFSYTSVEPSLSSYHTNVCPNSLSLDELRVF